MMGNVQGRVPDTARSVWAQIKAILLQAHPEDSTYEPALSELAGRMELALAQTDEALSQRDQDWTMAMAKALGYNSKHKIPLLPQADLFSDLFLEIRARQATETMRSYPPIPRDLGAGVVSNIAARLREECEELLAKSEKVGRDQDRYCELLEMMIVVGELARLTTDDPEIYEKTDGAYAGSRWRIVRLPADKCVAELVNTPGLLHIFARKQLRMQLEGVVS